MIKITVEFIPGGLKALRRTIAAMHISNESDLAPRSDYRVDIYEGDNPLAGTGARSATVAVRDHDRHQSVWQLIAAAIHAAQGTDID